MAHRWKDRVSRCPLPSGGRGDHDGVGIDLRDAEVAGKVEEVERTEVSGDLHEVHGAGAAGEDGDVVNVRAAEVEPQVGHGVVGLGALAGGAMGINEVLPAGGVEAGDEGGHGFGDVEGGLGEAVGVDGDEVQASEDAAGFGVVADDALGGLEHVAVEGEGGVGGGLVREGGHLLGDAGEGWWAGLLGGQGEGREEEGEGQDADGHGCGSLVGLDTVGGWKFCAPGRGGVLLR